MRRAVRALHLWLGLTLGSLLVLLGLTGSVLVFYPEIDALLHPEIRVDAPASATPDWDRALASLRQAYPEKAGPWRMEVTGRPGAIPARYYNPPERAHRAFAPMMVWLSPDGAQVLRRDYWGEYAMTFIYDLHYRLLLGETAGQVLGWSGFGLLLLLISGVWAWWPRGSWRKALRLKRRAHPQRRLRDWHKLTGLGGLILLLILTITGMMLELPDESDAALGGLGLPVASMPVIPPAPSGPVGLSIAQALERAQQAYPGARVAWIETPPQAGGTYRLRLRLADDPGYRFPHSFVWIDSANGRLRASFDLARAPAGNRINAWVHPLHDGSAGGLVGRIIAALAGLLPAILFITGLLRWKARKGHQAAARPFARKVSASPASSAAPRGSTDSSSIMRVE